MTTKNDLQSAALAALVQAAAGAYVTSQGKDYDDHSTAILDLVLKEFDAWLKPVKDTIFRARAAGLTDADPKLETELINSAATSLALHCAAQIIGEPQEAKPADAAVH